jgi:hypothetical protein
VVIECIIFLALIALEPIPKTFLFKMAQIVKLMNLICHSIHHLSQMTRDNLMRLKEDSLELEKLLKVESKIV